MTRFLISVALLSIVCLQALAVPAYPKPHTIQQPDGTEITVTLHGDENFSYATTDDGYTLLRDNDGFWTFADIINNEIQASGLRYNGNSDIAKGIAKGLTFTQNQLEQKRAYRQNATLQVPASFPTTGEQKLLLILVTYADTEPTYTHDHFDNYMNEPNYAGTGSFRDYYLRQSNEALDIQTTVTPLLQLSMPKSYYNPEIVTNLIIEALQLADEQIDFKDYDNNKDGILDGLAIIHQGFGQEMSGAKSDIWSHSGVIHGAVFDGIAINGYTIQPEKLATDEMTTIGVMCHEFGHNLGSPDFYDTDYELGGYFGGTGAWDLMASGAWNGHYGNRPAGFNPWQKYMFNWLKPALLEAECSIDNMKAISDNGTVYRINTNVPGEYFLLENRQQSDNFDSAIPGKGLLIYHVNENLISKTVSSNTLNAAYPQAIYLVCADAGTDPVADSPSSYGNPDTQSATFPGSKNIRTFSDNTLPSAKTLSGRCSYFSLDNITENESGIISFDFNRLNAPAPPRNVKATAAEGIVTLSWSAPESSELPALYSIYCNDTFICTTTDTEYLDESPRQGVLITYSVDATYSDGNTSPYVSCSVRVPGNITENLSATPSENAGVQIRWSLDKTLTRMPSTVLDLFTTTQYTANSLDYAQNFRSEDLVVYKGSQIYSVSFLPMNTPSETDYTIRIWETDSKGNTKLLREQHVDEFAPYTWVETMLKSPVVIVAGREYKIGIHCKSVNGDKTIIRICNDADTGNLAGQNIIKTDTEWYVDGNVSGNFCIYAKVKSAEPGKPTAITTPSDVIDPELDICYPIGFAIYRNGEKIGTCGNCVFFDPDADNGDSYAISCVYRGDNESVKSEPVTIQLSSVTSPVATSEINTNDRGITISNYYGTIEIYNLSGVCIFQRDVNGSATFDLPQGIYIIRSNDFIKTILIPDER